MDRNIGKMMAKYTAVGIGISAFIAVAVSAVVGLVVGGEAGMRLAKQFVAVLAIGIFYGAPAVIWLDERVAKWVQLLIALVPGVVVSMAVAWWVGWIPRRYGVWSIVGAVVLIVAFTAVISAICGVVFRSDVRRLNMRLKARGQRESSSSR